MTTQTLSSEPVLTSSFNWRLFGLLLAMVAFGLVAMIPYGLTVARQPFSAATVSQLAVQFLGQIFLYAFLIWAGLKLSAHLNLGAPALESWIKGEAPAIDLRAVGSTMLIGLLAGLGVLLLDVYLFAPRLQEQLQILGNVANPPAWQGFLASFYGGIVEEVMTRLFLLTLLAWLLGKTSHTADGRPTALVMWIAVLVSGLIFGIAHLPAAAEMGVQLTPLYVGRTLLLNGVGVLYGWLYWKRGLQAAMLAHWATDLVVHVLGALLV